MHALIDLDILCYEIGSAKRENSDEPLEWPLVEWRVDARIEQILDVTEAQTWQGYLSGKGNFREKIATIRGYKETRPEEKPFWHAGVFNYLRDNRNTIVVDGMEADDAITIAHMENLHFKEAMDIWREGEEIRIEQWDAYWRSRFAGTIICSRDKDFKQVSGWHYSWPSWKQEEQVPYWITPIEGSRFFYQQLLTGDTADSIPGLYGVGERSVHVARVGEMDNELDMFNYVKKLYVKYFRNYWELFLLENGKLLWLKRNEEDEWKIPS